MILKKHSCSSHNLDHRQSGQPWVKIQLYSIYESKSIAFFHFKKPKITQRRQQIENSNVIEIPNFEAAMTQAFVLKHMQPDKTQIPVYNARGTEMVLYAKWFLFINNNNTSTKKMIQFVDALRASLNIKSTYPNNIWSKCLQNKWNMLHVYCKLSFPVFPANLFSYTQEKKPNARTYATQFGSYMKESFLRCTIASQQHLHFAAQR